jgi:outer membrane protein TolC
MKYVPFFFLVVLCNIRLGYGQHADTLTLPQCYQMVRKNAPKLSMLNLIAEKQSIENKKINSQNLPQVSAYGKAWYQSDAVSVNFPPPINSSIEVDKFQYNAAVNIDQKLFDGGMASIQKELSGIQAEISGLETETGLYKLNEIANTYFFGIVSMQETSKVLRLKLESLSERKQQVASGVANGMVKPSELDRIESELISTSQQIIEIELSQQKLEDRLKILAGLPVGSRIVLKPEELIAGDSLKRPELKLFDANREYLEQAKSVQDKRYIPRLFAYGQAGYSYPGLNMFENQPAGFYMVGVKMSWNIFDWNMAKKEKQLINISADQVNIQEKDFMRNLQSETNNLENELLKLDEIIAADENIIVFKEKVTKASASALDNGTITSADYLADLNAELGARIEFEQHKLSKLKAMANLALLRGIEVK